jgi:hypothetical protein
MNKASEAISIYSSGSSYHRHTPTPSNSNRLEHTEGPSTRVKRAHGSSLSCTKEIRRNKITMSKGIMTELRMKKNKSIKPSSSSSSSSASGPVSRRTHDIPSHVHTYLHAFLLSALHHHHHHHLSPFSCTASADRRYHRSRQGTSRSHRRCHRTYRTGPGSVSCSVRDRCRRRSCRDLGRNCGGDEDAVRISCSWAWSLGR